MNRIITKLNCAKYCGIGNWLCLLTTQLYMLNLRIFGLYAYVRRDFQGHNNLSKYNEDRVIAHLNSMLVLK